MLTVARNLLARSRETIAEFVIFLKRKVSGKSSWLEEDINSPLTDPDVMPLPKNVRNAIKTASVRAKLVFDTYQWEWPLLTDGGPRIPTVDEIVDAYESLASSVMSQAMQVENGETLGSGNASSGHLEVELVDNIWMFKVLIADTIYGYDDGDELEQENQVVASLANAGQIG